MLIRWLEDDCSPRLGHLRQCGWRFLVQLVQAEHLACGGLETEDENHIGLQFVRRRICFHLLRTQLPMNPNCWMHGANCSENPEYLRAQISTAKLSCNCSLCKTSSCFCSRDFGVGIVETHRRTPYIFHAHHRTKTSWLPKFKARPVEISHSHELAYHIAHVCTTQQGKN